jgi:Flp pilus assembly protein TadD
MCRKLFLAATAVMALSAPSLAAAAAPPAAKAADPMAVAPAARAPATPPRKASAQERADADRLDPLARAAFWAREASLDPTDETAGVHLAMALRALGQYSEAAQTAQQVLIANPRNYDALMETARDFLGAGQGFYAIDPAKQAAALAPRDWQPVSLLGVAYSQVQRNDDAQATWSQALALSPDNPAVLSNMAMALAARGDAAQAETLLRRAVARPGANLQERQNLTLVLGLQGKLAEAEKLLREDLPPAQASADLEYLRAINTHPTASTAPARPGGERGWSQLSGAGG